MEHNIEGIKEQKQRSEAQMQKTVESLKSQIARVRTGRAQASMLDMVKVDYYGTPTPLSQVAAINCPDPKSFLISPWNAAILKDIEAAINKSNIGMTPINDGKVIRLKLPELTEERRESLARQVKKIIEDARISVRQCRKDANEFIKTVLKNKNISEDESKQEKDSIQELTDTYIKMIDEVGEKKEAELINV